LQQLTIREIASEAMSGMYGNECRTHARSSMFDSRDVAQDRMHVEMSRNVSIFLVLLKLQYFFNAS